MIHETINTLIENIMNGGIDYEERIFYCGEELGYDLQYNYYSNKLTLKVIETKEDIELNDEELKYLTETILWRVLSALNGRHSFICSHIFDLLDVENNNRICLEPEVVKSIRYITEVQKILNKVNNNHSKTVI